MCRHAGKQAIFLTPIETTRKEVREDRYEPSFRNRKNHPAPEPLLEIPAWTLPAWHAVRGSLACGLPQLGMERAITCHFVYSNPWFTAVRSDVNG